MPTVDPRRGFAPRSLTGAGSVSPETPVERVAVLDWARIERIVDGVVAAMFDNASTQVVERRQYAEILGFDLGVPLWTITDVEVSKFDEVGAQRAKEEILENLAVQMARGPEALVEALDGLLKVKQRVQAQLQQKLKTVNAAADSDAARLGQIVNGLETTELVCDVVTIWSPAGALTRAGKVVKWAGHAKEFLETLDEIRQRVGGVTGLVAAYRGDAEARTRVGAAVTAGLVEEMLGRGLAKAGRKVAAGATRRLRNSEVTELIPSTFAGPATSRRYSNAEVKTIMWRAEKMVDTAARIVELKPADRAGSFVFDKGRQLLSPGRTQR